MRGAWVRLLPRVWFSTGAACGLLLLAGCGASGQAQGQPGERDSAPVAAAQAVPVAGAPAAGSRSVVSAPAASEPAPAEGVAAAIAAVPAAPATPAAPVAEVSKRTGHEPHHHRHTDWAANAEVLLLALDPADDPGEGGGFHNWRIVAQVPVTDADQRRQVVYSVVRGSRPCAAPAHWNTTVAGGDLDLPVAFTPDRGMRVVRGGRTIDYLISQDGSRVQVYENGSLARESAAAGDLAAVFDRIVTGGAGR